MDEIETLLNRTTVEAAVALNETQSWSPETLKKTDWGYPENFFYERPASFKNLAETVRNGLSLIDEQQRELEKQVETLKNMKEQFNDALLIRPDPEHCRCELVQSHHREDEWGGDDYKHDRYQYIELNVNTGWIYTTKIKVKTTYYRHGDIVTRIVHHPTGSR